VDSNASKRKSGNRLIGNSALRQFAFKSKADSKPDPKPDPKPKPDLTADLTFETNPFGEPIDPIQAPIKPVEPVRPMTPAQGATAAQHPDPRLAQLAAGQIPEDLCPHPDRPIPAGYPNFSTLRTMSGRPPAATNVMGRIRGFGVLRFLLLSGVTGLAAFGIGSSLALFKPLPGDKMPPIEGVMRGLDQSSRAIQSLPQQWATGWAGLYAPKPIGIASKPLEPAQRAELEATLAQLQTEQRTIADRLERIETALGYRYDAPLDDRLRQASKLLRDTKVNGAQPLSISLPTDSLFEDTEGVLKPSASLVLDSLVAELQPYEHGLVTIAAHTDNIGPATANRELSLRRAQAVMTYLRDRQGRNLQWLAVGKGASEPIAKGDDTASQQRNRRLEIRVNPH
jgi:OmpA-OmpF porin, OOP family